MINNLELVKNRQRIKSTLLKLPFGLGSNLFIPVLRFGLSVFFYNKPIMKFRSKRIAKLEPRKILSAIQGGANRAIIVYDYLSSPPTYGDYLYVIMLARYFIAKRIFVSFIIVDSEFRKDWNAKTEKQIRGFVIEQVTLAEKLLDSDFSQIKQVSWEECEAELSNVSNYTIVPFYKKVRNRVAIYDHCFNLLNQLLSNASQNFLDKILFSYQELAPMVVTTPLGGQYISWACRYSEKWSFKRNCTDDEFIQIYVYLHRRFPDHTILVVSDSIGCEYFTKLAEKHNLDCKFSKNHSQTFLGDAALILNSDFFFQVRGGGTTVFPMFSKMPYEITALLVHELMWSRKRATSWQTDQQLFVNKAFLNSREEA